MFSFLFYKELANTGRLLKSTVQLRLLGSSSGFRIRKGGARDIRTDNCRGRVAILNSSFLELYQYFPSSYQLDKYQRVEEFPQVNRCVRFNLW